MRYWDLLSCKVLHRLPGSESTNCEWLVAMEMICQQITFNQILKTLYDKEKIKHLMYKNNVEIIMSVMLS